jgi:ferric-dicitrate binding protein FerR (iron transport regulator)
MVAVQEGEVDVRPRWLERFTGLRLRANDRAVISGTAVQVERGAGSDADVAWTHHRLVLRDAPHAEVVDAMRRWYGLRFDVEAGPLRERRVTASFGDEPGADVARVIAAAIGGRPSFSGDTVRVRPGRATVP